MIASLAMGIRVAPTWGLAVSLLSEIYLRASVNRICQVGVADYYEHKHQLLEKNGQTMGSSAWPATLPRPFSSSCLRMGSC